MEASMKEKVKKTTKRKKKISEHNVDPNPGNLKEEEKVREIITKRQENACYEQHEPTTSVIKNTESIIKELENDNLLPPLSEIATTSSESSSATTALKTTHQQHGSTSDQKGSSSRIKNDEEFYSKKDIMKALADMELKPPTLPLAPSRQYEITETDKAEACIATAADVNALISNAYNVLNNSVEICEDVINEIPTAPLSCDSGDFYSLQSMKQSLDNVGEINFKTMNQILEEEEAKFQIECPSRPIADTKISHLYDNILLENKELAVQHFLSTVQSSYPGFELYELLNNFSRAYSQLAGCEKSLLSMKDQCENFEKHVWTVSTQNLTKNGVCKDEHVVTGNFQVHTAKLNAATFSQLKKVLKDLKELLKDSFPLFIYSVQLCKTQIEHFFYKSFHHISLQHFEGCPVSYPTRELQADATQLKLCISTLFLFVRKHQSHPRFLSECQTWLEKCIGLLLRMATLEDHMFILNHVLRCPSGLVSKWSAKFVRIPTIPIPNCPDAYFTNSFGHIHLDYALTVLSCVLNTVEKRDEFLSQMLVRQKDDSSLQWVVVDSDGEDEPEDSTAFKESDIVSLLNQVPFESLFARILCTYQRDDELIYDEKIITEHSILKLIAFSNKFVEILGNGFETYSSDRYGRLMKLLGRLILHTSQYVTEHIDHFSPSANATLTSQQREYSTIMVEYDLFLLRIVKILLRGKNNGHIAPSLQFLASIPFNSVSIQMLWEMYALLTSWNMYDGNEMKSEDISSDFESELASISESNAFYLLTTMSSMAIAREGKDNGFVRMVAIHLFQIGFLSPLTRNSCSKQARDLLSSLTRKFPHLISVLILSIKPKMDILENMSLYLLKELAFSYWKPTESDINLLSNWLLNFPPSSHESQISRFVIQSMSWNFDDSGQMFLSLGVHRKIAILIVESQMKWEKEAEFLSWGWEVVKRLHLHAYDCNNNGCVRLTKFLKNLPTFEGHSELEPLRKSVENKHPLGAYVTLLMTPAGHSLPIIASKGFDLLEILLVNTKFEAVIHALSYITPLFAGSKESVTELTKERFMSIISSLLAADMTYIRMAKSLIASDFPGVLTKLFGEMIDTQVQQCERFGAKERKFVRLWTEILTGFESWNRDNNILYLLNILARISFHNEECRSYFYGFFIDLYKKTPEHQSGLTSFLFGWSNSANTTSLLPNPSYPQLPFLMYFILNIEMQIENLNGFWKSVCHSLVNPKSTLDSALKKASASSNYSPSINYLSIYRFAQQAFDIPLDCPLALVFWQKFFVRYFHRISADEHFQGGVGERFFEGMINTAFCKKLKKRLHELAEYYRNNFNEYSDSILQGNSESPAMNPSLMIEFHRNRMMLATAMTFWIEDSQLHKDSLYLPSLPPQFLPDRLNLLLEGSNDDWIEFVDVDSMSHISHCSMKSFLNFFCRMTWVEPQRIARSPDWIFNAGSHQEDILKRLKSYDTPIEPPKVPIFSKVLPVPTPTMYLDSASMNSGLQPHFKKLMDFAQLFSLQISQHTALDCGFIEFLPDLYANHESEALVHVRCNGTLKWEPCSGAAHIVFRFTEARLNERIGHQIQQNRTEYHTLIDQKGIQPPPETICISAVFIEDFITNLIICNRSTSHDSKDKSRISEVGKCLFYQIVSFMTDESNFYPPTRQLFSSFVEVLGAEFISIDAEQYKKLVDTCINRPLVVGALAPHINLVNADAKNLVAIYDKIANISRRDSDLAFVILTKLDIGAWLDKTKPGISDRSNLIQIMWKILTSEGISPSDSSQLIHDCFRTHLKTILLYEFPQHYDEILSNLLHGSDEQRVPITIWYDFFNALSNLRIRFLPEMEMNMKQVEVQRFATTSCILPHYLLLETIKKISQHFTRERLSHGIYGLYPKYRPYIDPISCFVQLLSYSTIVSALKNFRGDAVSKVTKEVWEFLVELYSPWILPYDQKMIQQSCANWIQQLSFESSSVLHAWIASDSQLAAVFVLNFAESISYFVENLPGASNLLSELLNFYLNHFAQAGVKEHVLCIVNNAFVNSVSWRIFWPSWTDVEAMNKTVEKYLPSAHSFLGCVFVQINWKEWIQDILSSAAQSSASYASKVHAILLNLTVRLANDGVSRELTLWEETMERAYTMKWDYVQPNSLEFVLNWFVMSVDPRIVLRLPNSHPMETSSLLLLKIASGYIDEACREKLQQHAPTSELSRKRYLYVRTYVRLLVSVASKYKHLLQTEAKNFEMSIKLMITDIVSLVKLEGQSKPDLMPPLKELVTLMANHYLGTITRNGFIEWCETNAEAPLTVLYGIIECSLDNQVPAYMTVPLVETAIGLCFKHKEATWDSIAEVALVTNGPALNSYFEVAYKDGHYLVLYSLFLRRFYHFTQGGLNTVSFLMDLVKNLKPKESNEAVLPLLCDIILKLNVHLMIESKRGGTVEKHVTKFLNIFAEHLTTLGQEANWRLLGALGLGIGSSKLSCRGRLLCRCVSAFVFAQLPANLPLRMNPEDPGHFSTCGSLSSDVQPHQDCLSSLEKLEALKLNRQYMEFHECIDEALNFIKQPSKCLTLCDIEDFIHKLTGSLFFTSRFFIKQK